MRNLLMISAFCLLVLTTVSGQVVEDTTYFKNTYSNEEVAPGKAKVIQITTKMPDGSPPFARVLFSDACGQKNMILSC
jgi:hypothetical protein